MPVYRTPDGRMEETDPVVGWLVVLDCPDKGRDVPDRRRPVAARGVQGQDDVTAAVLEAPGDLGGRGV